MTDNNIFAWSISKKELSLRGVFDAAVSSWKIISSKRRLLHPLLDNHNIFFVRGFAMTDNNFVAWTISKKELSLRGVFDVAVSSWKKIFKTKNNRKIS